MRQTGFAKKQAISLVQLSSPAERLDATPNVRSFLTRLSFECLTMLLSGLFLSNMVIATSALDRSALWDVVHDRCVTSGNNTDPPPCKYVNISAGEENGYAVLKDGVGATQFLLIPTRRLGGIESPELLASDAPNYWQAAWEARRFIAIQLGRDLPRNAIAMAVNSSVSRSQDQLHIHIDCVQVEVMERINDHANEIPEDWRELAFDLIGRRFMARRVESAELQGINPFRLLFFSGDAAQHDMAHETLIVVGARFSQTRDGFVLLSERANPMNQRSGHGEDLLDHTCKIADSMR